MGRFISADTLVPNPVNPQAFNRYTYCSNNPTGRIDPTGHDDYWYNYYLYQYLESNTNKNVEDTPGFKYEPGYEPGGINNPVTITPTVDLGNIITHMVTDGQDIVTTIIERAEQNLRNIVEEAVEQCEPAIEAYIESGQHGGYIEVSGILPDAFLDLIDKSGITLPVGPLGSTVIIRNDITGFATTEVHEEVHVVQQHVLGQLGFAVLYGLDCWANGYDNSQLEVQARQWTAWYNSRP